MQSMCTALEFYNELKKEITFLGENKKITEEPIRLLKPQIQMLMELFYSWNKRCISEDKQQSLIVDVLQKPDIDNGKVYEALVYAWLEKNGIQYNPQVHIEQANCFKTSNKGYDADGKIENNIVFDVKQFGISLPHFETLRKKLQDKIGQDYYLVISGGINISTRSVQSCFLEQLDKLAADIMNENNKIYTDYIYHDPKFGIEFRLYHKKSTSAFYSMSVFDPYEWAENNQFYFIYHSSQFCINSPYILFCPYDRQLALLFSDDKSGMAFTGMRALSRRIFMNLTKMDQGKINEFDGKARGGISVAAAAKKISAIVFVDVSEYYTYENSQVFVFLNPNADCKISRYQIDSMFRFAGAKIETFEHDNY